MHNLVSVEDGVIHTEIFKLAVTYLGTDWVTADNGMPDPHGDCTNVSL